MFEKNTFLKEIMTAWIQIINDKNILMSAMDFMERRKYNDRNKTIFRTLWYKKGIKHKKRYTLI